MSTQLKALFRELYGRAWLSGAARDLNVSRKTIWLWANTETQPQRRNAGAIRCLIEAKIARLESLRAGSRDTELHTSRERSAAA